MIASGKYVRLACFCAALFAAPFAIGAVRAADSDSGQIDTLARDVERAEAIRAVGALEHSYTQYAQFGLWNDLGALFAADGEVIWGDETIKGPAAIAKYNMTKFGGGKPGLPSSDINMMMIDRPLINLSADGNSAKGRWHGFFMEGGGDNARWEGGIFENDYVKDKGEWKIARQHYYPQFAGPYETGWKNVGETQPIVPYHFTPDEAGVPVPPPIGATPHTKVTLVQLENRIDAMNEEDKVRNLQNAYGYYIDRKMWDDVTDLFTTDGVLEMGGVGIYDGSANIRRALERDGLAGLKRGQFNDHLQLAETVEILSNGTEARIRGIDMGMLADVDSSTGFWSVSVFSNRFVKGDDGKWRIREMRVFPVFKTDYYQGWGKSRIVDPAPAKEYAPNRPVPAADAGDNAVPAFFLTNPATGKPVSYPPGLKVVAKQRLLPTPAAAKHDVPSSDMTVRIAEDERRLAVSKAYDGAVNLSSAYGEYLDDSQWPELGAIFAKKGAKEVPYAGFYIGPARIAHRTSPGPSGPRRGIPFHSLIQPVILVAADGRSAAMRTRLFQLLTSTNPDGAIVNSAMYPNDQAILENGVWKLWSISIDETYVRSAGYKLGWARQRPTGARQPFGFGAVSPALAANPPDIWDNALGERERGFAGGTGETIAWPDILPMWFSYKNPVSGRVPEHYWSNCETCVVAPDTSMDRHGYMLPPS